MDAIKQVALRLFHDQRTFNRDEVMYEALAIYMASKGLTPGFEVRKKK